jgi:hypothetical protein
MALDSVPVEHLFTITAKTGEKKPAMIKDGPNGTRIIVTVTGGTFSGPKLNGTIADTAAGDWVIIRPDGTMALDVRLILTTDDGAHIYMTYSGFGKRLADGSTMIRTAPLFETGDERYAWLNSIQAVSHGSTGDGTVTYDVYGLL